MVGSTVEEAVDDDEVSQRAQVKYEVVGTLSENTAEKPSCVMEIVEVLHSSISVSIPLCLYLYYTLYLVCFIKQLRHWLRKIFAAVPLNSTKIDF